MEIDYTSYDAAGNLLGYKLSDLTSANYTNTYTYTLTKGEGYQEKTISATSTTFQPGTTTNGYDVNGNLISVSDSTKAANSRTLVNDAAGRALFVNQNGNVQRQLIVNGEVLGRYGVGIDEVTPRVGDGDPNFKPLADFSFGYQPINGNYPTASPGSYTVQAGDTLGSIARGAYGDAQLWWRVADANGLTGDADLRVGRTLSIPNRVGTVHNGADSFKPYDPSKITGDTTPNMPAPNSGNDCGGLGTLLVIIVAIVVTIYTAGAAAAAWGAAGTTAGTASAATVGATFSSGATALAGGYGAGTAIAAGAIGGAVGSIVSQGVGIAIGAQQDFSWKQVALSAIAGGASGGVGASGAISTGNVIANAAVRAAVGNAVSQGIAVATGLQSSFNWRGVAAAAAGGAAGELVGQALSTMGTGADVQAGGGMWKSVQEIAQSSLRGFAAGLTTATMRGGRVSVTQVAVDAFGNALGSSLAEMATSGGAATAPAPYQDGDVGRSELRFSNEQLGEQRQADSDQFANAFANHDGSSINRANGVQVVDASDVLRVDRDRKLTNDDVLNYLNYVERQAATPSTGGASSAVRGSGELSSPVLYRQGLGDIRDTSPTFSLASPVNDVAGLQELDSQAFGITVAVPHAVFEATRGVGDLAANAVAATADMTVAPLVDTAQVAMKALHGAVTGDYQPLVPLSSFGRRVANDGAGTWDGMKTTGVNVFNVSPAGMVYHSFTGANGAMTAAMNGDVRAATRDGLGVGLTFAGAKAAGLGGFSFGPSSSGLAMSGRSQIGAIGTLPPRPAGRLTQVGDATYLIDEGTGLTVRAEGLIEGPHVGRGKGRLPEPIGGRLAGEHRGHLVPEGGVRNPADVNVAQNLISEAPGSNLGLKKVIDLRASRIAAENPSSVVQLVADPVRAPGQPRPFAASYYITRDGVIVDALTVLNR